MSRRRLAMIVLGALLWPVAAWATGANLRSCTLTWGAPTTNADGTALTDLAGYHVWISGTSGTYTTYVATVPAPKPNPAAGDTATWVCVGLTQGQKYVVITAFDLAGNESARSNEVPFVYDVLAPSNPASLSVGP